MIDVAVVGAGLFGTIITDALRKQGMQVALIDDHKPARGSDPAACLMKPSWLSTVGKAVYNPALEMLNGLYGVQKIPFKTQLGSVEVFWVPPSTILQQQKVSIVGTVELIRPKGPPYTLVLKDATELQARVVIVAAGIWTEELVPLVRQTVHVGMAFLWPRERIAEPFIKVWAPYKQIVAFNREDGLWVGDGNSILRQEWGPGGHAQAGYRRCVDAVKCSAQPIILFGSRPYHHSRPCLLREFKPSLWVATGGAKNGTMAAGWCAAQLIKALA